MKLRVFMFACIIVFGPAVQASAHIWSKQGTTLNFMSYTPSCPGHTVQHAYSPDHSKQIRIECVHNTPIQTLLAGNRNLPIAFGAWVQVEALWAPDSRSVALTGNFNGYTNSTRIFRIGSDTAEPVSLALIAHDMARKYPPCKAANAELPFCNSEKDGADFNYATVAWASPTIAVIMAEVPCDSLWGGIMCQIQGYEIDIRTGQILHRMTARELKARWQSKLAWNLRIPDPPKWDVH